MKGIEENALRNLQSLDRVVEKELLYEPHGLLSGRGGCSLYFMHRYLQTGRAEYADQSLHTSMGFLNGLSGVGLALISFRSKTF